MAPRKINGHWYADFWFHAPGGERQRVRKRAPINTEVAARQLERAWVKEQFEGAPLGEMKVVEAPTLEQYAPVFMTSSVGNKRNSFKDKESIFRLHLLPRWGNRRIDGITVNDLDTYKTEYTLPAPEGGRGLSKKTVNNHLIVINALLKKAFDDGVVPRRVKAKLFKLRSVRDTEFRFLSFDERDRLLDAAQKDPDDFEWYVMTLVGVFTGMRIGELQALRWAWVDLPAGRLVVRERYHKGVFDTPKSGSNREIPLHPRVVAALKALRHMRGPLVFCDPSGEVRKWSAATWALKRIARRAGLADWDSLGWHELRHTFASHLVMKGAPLKAVQELLGHATIELTLRYSHLSPEVKRDCVLLLGSGEPAGMGSSGG
jgi:integrase